MMKGLELKKKTKRLQRGKTQRRKRRKEKRKKRRLTGTLGKDTKSLERRRGPKGGGATDRK